MFSLPSTNSFKVRQNCTTTQVVFRKKSIIQIAINDKLVQKIMLTFNTNNVQVALEKALQFFCKPIKPNKQFFLKTRCEGVLFLKTTVFLALM